MPLANLSNPLGGGASPSTGIVAGGVLYGLNGQTITGNSSGAWAIVANGTNQNVTLTPSGTGKVVAQFQTNKFVVDDAAAGLAAVFLLPTASNPSGTNYLVAADSTNTYINATSSGVAINVAGTQCARFAANTVDVNTGANGQLFSIKSLTELTTVEASAFTDTAIQMPANSIVLSVSVRVVAAITCTSTFTVGDAGSATRFVASASKAITSVDPGTKAGAYYNASAAAVRITPDTTPSDNTGRVRVTISYILVTPPTS